MGGDGPPRGGTRGGRDQFDWESVKADKDREYYLGASVKATVGRWQKGRDILWYTKGKEGALSAADERAAVKEEEERLMQEALGLRPVTARRGASALDAHETRELLKREGGADGLGGGEEAVAERVKGLGYSRLAADSGPARPKQGEEWGTREVLGGLVEPAAAAPAPAPAPAARAQRHDSDSSSSSSGGGGGGGGGGERRAEKRARKEARKERRAEKRARKEERRAKRRRSRSRSREEGRRRSRSRDERRRSGAVTADGRTSGARVVRYGK